MKDKMLSLYVKFQNAMKRKDGQGMVEYGLIIAAVAILAVVGLRAFGGELNTFFDGLKAKLK